MTIEEYVSSRVRQAYGDAEIPCAPTSLQILGELFDQDIHEQVLQASRGLNGAGQHGEQCGLVEGPLMLIGLLSHRRGLGQDDLYRVCSDFAEAYAGWFGSLLCRRLRPGGFNEDDPPHLCEPLTLDSILFSARFIAERFGLRSQVPVTKNRRDR